jgi:hypothetical protein
MNVKYTIIYKSALKNNEFLIDIYDADKDNPPNVFSSSLEKHFFTLTYYGWMVGKYGKEWKSFL